MSIKHLEILAKQLANKGWEIKNPNSDDLYHVANDFTVCWEIKRGFYNNTITFPILPHLGGRSEDLNDIFYCKESANGTRLYFDKTKSEIWKANLREWVNNLSSP